MNNPSTPATPRSPDNIRIDNQYLARWDGDHQMYSVAILDGGREIIRENGILTTFIDLTRIADWSKIISKPSQEYQIRVIGKKGGVWSSWSGPISFQFTAPVTVSLRVPPPPTPQAPPPQPTAPPILTTQRVPNPNLTRWQKIRVRGRKLQNWYLQKKGYPLRLEYGFETIEVPVMTQQTAQATPAVAGSVAQTGTTPTGNTVAPAPAPATQTGWRLATLVQIGLAILILIGVGIWAIMPEKETVTTSSANPEVNQVNQRPPEVVLIKNLSTVEPVTENILDEYVDPRKWVGGELTTTKFVGPGNGKHFIKPEGWIVECTIWAHKHDGTEYSRLINTNTLDAPVWTPNTNLTQIVLARGIWVRYKGAAEALPPEGMKVTFTLTPRTSL